LSTTIQNLLAKNHDAFLFDMDGTLLNSITVVERVWSRWAVGHGIEPTAFLKTIHGMRAIDVVVRESIPGVDPIVEAERLKQEEMEDVDGIISIPGAIPFLASIPEDRWAIVTSAPRDLAVLRMAAAGIPCPTVMICAEDIPKGKPDPAGYKLAAEKLGFTPENCVVFEDAPAGILAGERTGADVVVIHATHSEPHVTDHLSIGSYDELVLTQAGAGALKLALAP
jgi:sugar-phosphatase